MVTRRTAIGAGLAFAAVACGAGFGAQGASLRLTRETGPIDALLIDETIETPRQMAAAIAAGTSGALPVVGIQLDAAGQAGLLRVFDTSHAVVGISSGATLFCLERIGWDHGFRLMGRREWRLGGLDDEACRRDVAAYVRGARLAVADPLLLVRDYRPSRADGTLHAWVMKKSGPELRQGRREV